MLRQAAVRQGACVRRQLAAAVQPQRALQLRSVLCRHAPPQADAARGRSGWVSRPRPLRRASHLTFCNAAASAEADDTMELEIKVEGMVCGGCSSRVEEALKKQANVKAVSVSLDSKIASVEVEAASITDAMDMLPQLVDTVKGLGFEAEPHIEYELNS